MNVSSMSLDVSDQAILNEINRKQRIELAPAIVYVVLTLVVGIVGNPVAIYIYAFHSAKTTTRLFLLWLSCMDLLNCLATSPFEIYLLSSFYYMPYGEFCYISRFFGYIMNGSTLVVLAAIAIDRYILICHPFKKPVSIRCAKIACVASLIFGLSIAWPVLFLFGRKVVRIPTKSSGRGYVVGILCNIRNEMDSTPYPYIFFVFLTAAIFGFLLLLSVLYVRIGRVIIERRRLQEERRRTHFRGSARRSPKRSVQSGKNERQPSVLTEVEGVQREGGNPDSLQSTREIAQNEHGYADSKVGSQDTGRIVRRGIPQHDSKGEVLAVEAAKQLEGNAGGPVVKRGQTLNGEGRSKDLRRSVTWDPQHKNKGELSNTKTGQGLEDETKKRAEVQDSGASGSEEVNAAKLPDDSEGGSGKVEEQNPGGKDVNSRNVTATTSNDIAGRASKTRPRRDCCTACVNSVRGNRPTLMLFSISAVFILSYVPFLTVIFVRQHIGPSFYTSLTTADKALVNILSRSYLVNNCANPIVYGLFNAKFRNEVRKIFRLGKPRSSSVEAVR